MNAIREFRERAGLTQEQLGVRCELTKAAISNYEVGVRDPDRETSRQIVKALNDAGAACTLDEVFPPEESAA